MKKYVLVLCLVMALSDLANAVLSLDYEDGWLVIASEVELIGGISFPIGSNTKDPRYGILISEDGQLPGDGIIYRTVGAPVNAPDWQLLLSGPSAIAAEIPWNGGAAVLAWGDPVITPNPAGEWLRISFPGYTLASETHFICQVDLHDSVIGEIHSVYLIPEPASLLLLGLGGLLIRKR